MLAGSPHTSCLTPEGSKVVCPHGNIEGSASHSEQPNAILYLWPTLETLQWDREEKWRDR
jgi:hypothetical protein